jgi:hypothetical protein
LVALNAGTSTSKSIPVVLVPHPARQSDERIEAEEAVTGA